MKKEQLEKELTEKFKSIGLKIVQAHKLEEGFPKNQFDISFEVKVDDFLKTAGIESGDNRFQAIKRFQRYSEVESSSRGEKKVFVEISKYLEDDSRIGAYVLNNQLSLRVDGEMDKVKEIFDIYGYGEEVDKINFVRTFSEEEANNHLNNIFKISKQRVMLDRNLLEIEIHQQVTNLLEKFKEGVK